MNYPLIGLYNSLLTSYIHQIYIRWSIFLSVPSNRKRKSLDYVCSCIPQKTEDSIKNTQRKFEAHFWKNPRWKKSLANGFPRIKNFENWFFLKSQHDFSHMISTVSAQSDKSIFSFLIMFSTNIVNSKFLNQNILSENSIVSPYLKI